MKTWPMRYVAFQLLLLFVFAITSHVNTTDVLADESQSSDIRDSRKVTDADSAASNRPVLAEGYLQQPLAYDEVRPAGILADRIHLSLDKLIRDQKMHTGYATWGADQIGRWIGAVAVLSAVSGENHDQDLRPKIAELIASQSPAGVYYGDKLIADPSNDNVMRVWFGQGRALWNLLEYYNISGDQRSLESLTQAANATVADQSTIKKIRPFWGDRTTPAGISCGIESGLGAMVVLGQITKNNAYFDYARYLADNMPIHVGKPSNNVRGGLAPTELVKFEGISNEHHTHSYLSMAHGLVDLAVATGDSKYLTLAQDIFENSLPSVWINGDFPEGYGQVFEHRDETCSAVDWSLLALKLFDATGNVRYLDVAELSIVNQLFQGQDFQGGYTCYRSLDRRHWMDKDNYGGVHQACCSMHGGLALGYVASHVVTKGKDGLSVNLPMDVDVDSKDSKIKLSQRIDIGPQVLKQTLKVSNQETDSLRLKIRIPYWCDDATMEVNGSQVKLDVKDGFAEVQCGPEKPTEIVVSLPMKFTVIPARTNVFTKAKGPVSGEANESGLQLGPFALMMFREMFPDVTDRDISLTLHLDDQGRPLATLDPPSAWRSKGAYNLFVKARIEGGKEVTLTPCANSAMAPFKVVDPYVLRFSELNMSR